MQLMQLQFNGIKEVVLKIKHVHVGGHIQLVFHHVQDLHNIIMNNPENVAFISGLRLLNKLDNINGH